MKLDKTKPYSTVHQGGDSHDGKCFGQNGVYFTANGEEWVPPKSQAELDAERQQEFNAAVEARALSLLRERDENAKTSQPDPATPASEPAAPADSKKSKQAANLNG